MHGTNWIVLRENYSNRNGIPMDQNVTALERTFTLAKSGDYATISEILQQLKAEGYSTEQVMGPALGKQLRSLIAVAASSGANATSPLSDFINFVPTKRPIAGHE